MVRGVSGMYVCICIFFVASCRRSSTNPTTVCTECNSVLPRKASRMLQQSIEGSYQHVNVYRTHLSIYPNSALIWVRRCFASPNPLILVEQCLARLLNMARIQILDARRFWANTTKANSSNLKWLFYDKC